MPSSPSAASRRAFGAANVATAALVTFGVFVGLSTRWWPVDVAAALVALLQLSSGVALLASLAWASRIARAASAVSLALGLFAVTVLAVTASWLSGVYGPVGRGGSIVLALVAALVLPYLVVLPLAQLVWLRPRSPEV
jgi:hypothetical protein